MTDWLLGTLVATSGLALFVLAIREPVRKRFGSRVTYGLWLIPAARLFMPTLTHTVERRIPVHTSMQPFIAPFVREPLWMARVSPAGPSLVERLGGWPAVLLAVWLAVASGLFLSRMIAFHRDRRAILASSVGVDRLGSVRIVRTPEVVSPVALGILDRIVAVPFDFERRYCERERRLVLEHELAHHRSGDLVANLFAFILLCLQWFNPLAWVAHAAFRFDQEAACDARVLDGAGPSDRGEYGRAIAKAASGRALLFASALDQRNTLHRRLQSMLNSSSPARRFAGHAVVFSAIAAALPLTASHAVQYVDVAVPVASPEPVAPATPATAPSVAPVVHAAVVPAAAVAAQQAPAAAPVARAQERSPDTYDNLTISGDLVTIDGKTKRWEELTPAEKARVRDAVAKANAALANVHLDTDRIRRDLAQIPTKAQIDKIEGDLARTRAKAIEAERRMAGDARGPGRDADQIEAALAAALQSIDRAKLETSIRALAAVDPAKIAASVAGAQQSMEAAKAELARIQARIDADQHR